MPELRQNPAEVGLVNAPKIPDPNPLPLGTTLISLKAQAYMRGAGQVRKAVFVGADPFVYIAKPVKVPEVQTASGIDVFIKVTARRLDDDSPSLDLVCHPSLVTLTSLLESRWRLRIYGWDNDGELRRLRTYGSIGHVLYLPM